MKNSSVFCRSGQIIVVRDKTIENNDRLRYTKIYIYERTVISHENKGQY